MHFWSLHFLSGGSRQFSTNHLGFLNGPFTALQSHSALCNNLGLALSFDSWISLEGGESAYKQFWICSIMCAVVCFSSDWVLQ